MPSHVSEKRFGESFRAHNDAQAGLLSQFVDFSTADPALEGEQLLESIREAMSPMQLVHPDILKNLPIYQKIRVFLERYSISTPIAEESGNLVARRLICRIWDSKDYARERHLALQAFDYIRNGVQVATASVGYASITQDLFGIPSSERGPAANERSDSQPRNATRVLAGASAMRFSSDSSQFSGQTEECWDKYLAEDLTAVAKDTQTVTPQTPRECNTDHRCRTTLQNANRVRTWALQVFSSGHSKKLSYQQLLHFLKNSLLQCEAHQEFDGNYNPDDAVSKRKGLPPETHSAGQVRCGRKPKFKAKVYAFVDRLTWYDPRRIATQELSVVGWVKGDQTPADASTKVGRGAALNSILETGRIDLAVDQWVVRTPLVRHATLMSFDSAT